MTDVKDNDNDSPCIYLCGNSLGLQPRRTSQYVQAHLTAWAQKGVTGHFTSLEDSPLPDFLSADQEAAKAMAPLVGGWAPEVAGQPTQKANLNMGMCSLYRTDRQGRFKVMIESKAFPSDHVSLFSDLCIVVSTFDGFDFSSNPRVFFVFLVRFIDV